MSFASKIENKGIFATSIFYAIAGILFLVLFPLNGYAPHLGLLGIFSLGTFYGLFRTRSWSLWLVMILFISGTTFAIFTLYTIGFQNLLYNVGVIAYLILTWISAIYVAAKRETLKV